jgi:hypothetical protein
MKSPYRKRKIAGRTVQAHRVVVEDVLGRPLDRFELVHHVNEDKFDNRPENLRVLTPQAHSQLHNQRHPRVKTCEVCGEAYVPHATKRKRAKTCSWECRNALIARRATERYAAQREVSS